MVLPMVCLLAAGAVPAPRKALALPASPSVADLRGIKVLAEPLVPIGGEPTPEENAALARALERYEATGVTEAVDPLIDFLNAHPSTPWAASLLTDVGVVYRHTGRYTKALGVWEQAWSLSKKATVPAEAAIANRALAELAELNGRVGRMNRIQELLKEAEGRTLVGSAGERLDNVREGLWNMEHDAAHSFRCGPLGLDAVRAAMGLPFKPQVETACSTQQGTSLAQNAAWAESFGIPLQMAKRQPGAEVIVPSLVHWKLGHFAAVVKQEGQRFLVKDPTFGEEIWVTRAALDDEATGYALVPKGTLPTGWARVGDAEGRTVWGKGNVPPKPEGPEVPDGPSCPAGSGEGSGSGSGGEGGTGDSSGMPRYAYFKAQTSLAITDTPVSYAPPRGYPVHFTLTYFQRNAYQPQSMQFGNVGSKWNFDWLAYITDDPTTVGQTVTFFNASGGQRSYTGFNSATGTYANQFKTHDQLIRNADSTYTRVMPDGSKEIYGQSDGATTYPRHLFLTQKTDSSGNTLSFAYDAQLRLITVTDALGQVTTLSYELASDPLKVTKVTDPFGRTAVLAYTASGLLASITDAVGMTSSFAYGPNTQSPNAPADFIHAMTTPYGTTAFQTGNGTSGNQTWVVATDPMGNSERLEFYNGAPGVAATDPNPPAGFMNNYLQYRNVYFWDKRAMALYPGDYSKAKVNHYLHSVDGATMIDVLESSKAPLERRVWLAYPGQADTIHAGTGSQPSKRVRVLEDGSQQVSQFEYNAWGKVTKSTDPTGRVMSYVYSADGLDLLEVHNITGGQDDLLAKYTYNAQHKPVTVADASGQMTSFTYNGFGQLLTVTNPKHETTSLTYDASGYLQGVQGPVAGALTSFTYDPVGRIHTVTNPDGYTLTYDYDALDRRTKVTYPDTTTEQTVFDRLDVGSTKDRLNRWTLMTYNPLRQLTEVQDPQGRTTHLNWCGCGSLESLVDAKGNITLWSRDLQGRVIAKIYPDLSATTYAYDCTGRLINRTDARGQVTSYAYFLDDNLRTVVYTNAVVPTPPAAYTYDGRYNRLATSTGGTGTTTYTYNPVTTTPALGATRLATVTGPMPNSDISYGYDELGRVASRSIHGVAETRAFDALGRLSTVTNPLGTFGYTYDGATNRLLKMTYPNGQVTNYSYLDNTGDKRLQSIQNLKSDASNISTFAYTYDATGQIQSWSRQADAQAPTVYTYTYDPVGQLLGATLTNSATNQVLSSYGYGYDDSGNRTTEQINGAVTTSSYNDLNQLTGQSFSATPSLAGPKGGETPAARGHARKVGIPRRLRKPAQPRAPKAQASPSASRVDEVTK
ncbi:MAG TPA: hypothetical protein VJ623_14595 [Holophagaceae bacterium]|nr:hypothetical protein [Holophagaceae bacterium]